MPIYDYKCDKCGKTAAEFRSVKDRNNSPLCHGRMTKVFSTAAIAPILGGGSMPGYQCPITDTFVTSRKQRKEIMARNNAVEMG